MKITDTELLKAIWINQLRLLSKAVIQNYIGGGVSVCDDSDHSYDYTSSEHIASRIRVTDKISKGHLLSRLKKLKREDLIKTRLTRYGHKDDFFLVFMIENEKSLEAFKSARQFWIDKGVPTGYSELPDERGCANTTKSVDVEALLPECEKMLMEKYGS